MMINLRRRFFLFGATAVVAAPVAKKIFIMPRLVLPADAMVFGRIELDAMQYRHSALLAAEIDRKVIDAMSGVTDLLKGNAVPTAARWALLPETMFDKLTG